MITISAKPATTLTTTGLALPFTSAEIAAEHEQDLAALRAFARYPDLVGDDGLAVLDSDLTNVARLRDELVKRRQAPVAEIKRLIATVEGWFRPYLKDVDAAIDRMKSVKGAYLTAKANAAADARRAAQAAAQEGDSSAVLAAIQTAQALEVAPAGTRYAWEATIVNEGLIPDEYWIVDRAKIDAVAKAMGSSEEQSMFVPGVKFARVAVVQARRK